MNPATDDTVPERLTACSPTRTDAAAFTARNAATSSSSLSASASMRKSHLFQRRLKEKISESRALELLDRRIKGDRVITESAIGDGASNQEQDDELVCDSTMVRFAATPEETVETRTCGVLKTVRGIHRQRERDRLPVASGPAKRENQ